MRRLIVLVAGCALLLVGVAAASAPTGSGAETACVPRWRVVAKGASVPVLHDVSALSASDVWAVGSRGALENGSKPVAVHWDGHRLQAFTPFMPSPQKWGRQGELNGVMAISHDDVWAVGLDGWGLGRPVAVHWDGRRWARVRTPSVGTDAALSSVTAFGTRDVWAVGQADDRALVMRWNGQAWRLQNTSEVGPKGSGLEQIDGTSARDVWAVGSQGNDAPMMAGIWTLVLHWDGQAWNELTVPPGGRDERGAGSVDVRTPRDAWTTHYNVTEGTSDVVVHWSGPGKASVAYTLPGNGGLDDIATVSRSTGWVVGYRYGDDYERSRPLILRWGGRSFRLQHTALDHLNIILSSLSALSGTEIWAAGGAPTSSDGKLGTGLLARYSCK